MTDEMIRTMAETAITVVNWSRRIGLGESEEIEQVALAMQSDRDGKPWPEALGDHMPEIAQKQSTP